MRFLDLFAGIGGFSLGLERAGWTCVGQVEVDHYCRHKLARHWPHVFQYGDVRLLEAEVVRERRGAAGVTMQLNPRWVCALMGFPLDWLD